MKKNSLFAKSLAVVGTVLVWLPVVAPLLFSGVRLAQGAPLLIDFLMPAELFPVVLVAGAVLLAVSLWTRSRRALIGWGCGVAIGMLVAGQGLAALTGLASGATAPTGWPVMLVLGSMVIYDLAVLELGVAGVLLCRDLLRRETDGRQGPATMGVEA